MVYHVGTEQR